MARLIQADRSVIVACDVDSLGKLQELVRATRNVPGIGGYKVGLELALRYGLPKVIERMRQETCLLPIIYDHQKGGTDIPELGVKFARAVAEAKANAVILFPFGGARTERDWIKACQDVGLHVLVGGHMTQPEFLHIEGGFIDDKAPRIIYFIAAQEGVRDFVVPGNKPEVVAEYYNLLKQSECRDEFALYAPGFVNQGGVIADTAKVAGPRWHAIVGSAIYKTEDMNAAARKMTRQILSGGGD